MKKRLMWRYTVAVCVCVVLLLVFAAVWWGRQERSRQHAPRKPLAICKIFKAHPNWYHATRSVERQYGVPIHLQMAVIYEESRFRANAVPKRRHLFGWLPWLRRSTAEGYSQALDETWHYYLKETGQLSANRRYFSDSVAFIGWYLHRIHQQLGIPMWHVSALYLAYHQGIHGYLSGDYRHNKILREAADRVQRVAWHYHARLLSCGLITQRKKNHPTKPANTKKPR